MMTSMVLALLLAGEPVEFNLPIQPEETVEARPDLAETPNPNMERDGMGVVVGVQFDFSGKWRVGVCFIKDEYQTDPLGDHE